MNTTPSAPNVLAQWESPLLLGAVSCYALAMLLLWAHLFFRSDEPPERGRAWHEVAELGSLALLFAGANLHALSLLGQGSVVWTERAGVVGVFGCALVVAYLLWRQRVGQTTLGAFVTPIALLAALYSLTAPPLHTWEPSRLEPPWLVVHVALILGGYVALAFAFSASVIYLVQDTLLKRKKLKGLWQRLPSLQVADEVIFRATRFGLALLTLGLFIGVAWQARHQPDYAFWRDPKVAFSFVTWATFATYLGARAWLGWRGRRTNMVVVYGFVLLVISFLGAPHMLPGR
jgi:ABC-type uncharacterized transport system permease subunit